MVSEIGVVSVNSRDWDGECECEQQRCRDGECEYGGKVVKELNFYIRFMYWEVIYIELVVVVVYYVDLISFEDVFCDFYVVELWKFIQMKGKTQLYMLLEFNIIGIY